MSVLWRAARDGGRREGWVGRGKAPWGRFEHRRERADGVIGGGGGLGDIDTEGELVEDLAGDGEALDAEGFEVDLAAGNAAAEALAVLVLQPVHAEGG